MQASSEGTNHSSSYSWLWQNPEFADVALDIVFSTSQVTGTVINALISSSHQSMVVERVCTSKETLMSGQPLGFGMDACTRSHGAQCLHDAFEPEVNSSTSTCSKAKHHLEVEQPVVSFSSTKRYLLHSQVISSNSAFLRASLTTAVGAAKRKRGGEDDVCRWQIRVEMAAEDAEAVEAVLQCFYKQHLDDAIPGADLLSIMKVADNWQAPSVAEIASKVLCQRTASFPISDVYTLPDTLKASSFFKDVMAAAEISLLATFGDTIVVVNSTLLLKRFLALPQPALLALVRSNSLRTDAEETILLLVHSWCEGSVGKACSTKQLQALNKSIRYGCLSRPFLTDLCDVYMRGCPQLTREQLMELWVFTPSSDEDDWRRFKSVNPHEWYLPGRCHSIPYLSTATVKLMVTEEDLILMLESLEGEEDSAVESAGVYAKGFMWRLSLQVREGKMYCEMKATGVSDISDPGGLDIDLKHGVRCVSSIHIDALKPFLLFESDCMLVTSFGVGTQMGGSNGVFPEADEFEWWEEFIVDGCVGFTASARPTAPL